MIHTLGGTGISHELTIIRDSTTGVQRFRQAIHRIGLHLAVEVSKHLPEQHGTVETPLATTEAHRIAGNVVLVPVLRAGLGLLNAFLEILPEASVGFEGLRRNEETLLPYEYYSRLPKPTEQTTAIVLDPMLATGGSMVATMHKLQEAGFSRMCAASVIAAPEGLNAVAESHPHANIVVAAIDSHLNSVGFIVPGLGDAGDRMFGTE